MYIHILYISLYIHVYIHTYTHTHIYIYICTHICRYVCIPEETKEKKIICIYGANIYIHINDKCRSIQGALNVGICVSTHLYVQFYIYYT